MAKFYGNADRYLIEKDLKYFFLIVAIALFVLAAVLLIFKLAPAGIAGVAAFFGVIFLTVLAEPIMKRLEIRSMQFYRGFNGEQDVKKELEKLSDDFSVFRDIVIGENKGNIDFVVVGPTGIFLLEVKSHRGEIGYNGSELTLKGRLFPERNVFRQVHGEIWALKNYLSQKIGSDIFIHSVLVFSSPQAEVNFGFEPVEKMFVLQKNSLLDLFNRFPLYSYNPPRPAVEQCLALACSSH